MCTSVSLQVLSFPNLARTILSPTRTPLTRCDSWEGSSNRKGDDVACGMRKVDEEEHAGIFNHIVSNGGASTNVNGMIIVSSVRFYIVLLFLLPTHSLAYI